MVIELPIGDERFRALSLRGSANQMATTISRSTRSAELSRTFTTSKTTAIPILLSSRPNPSSISRLLKKKYRMARFQVPSRPMRLPTAKEQRGRPKKAQSVPPTNNRSRRGRPPKASTLAARKAADPKPCGGSQALPIVIPEDNTPILRPEKAPISYVDYLLWPSERLVTPEVSPFQYTPANDWSPKSMCLFSYRTSVQAPYQGIARCHRTNRILTLQPRLTKMAQERNWNLDSVNRGQVQQRMYQNGTYPSLSWVPSLKIFQVIQATWNLRAGLKFAFKNNASANAATCRPSPAPGLTNFHS